MAHRRVLGGAGGARCRCQNGLGSDRRRKGESRNGAAKNDFHVGSPVGLLARPTALSIDQEIRGGRGSARGVSPRVAGELVAATAIGDGARGSASKGVVDGKPEQSIRQSIKHSSVFAGTCSSGTCSCESAISAQWPPLALASALAVAAIAELPPSIPSGATSRAKSVSSRRRCLEGMRAI